MKKVLCFALMLPFFCVAAALADDGDKSSDRREEFRKRMQEAIKKYDKDDDGKLDDGERKAMFEAMRKQWAERMEEGRKQWAERAKERGGDDKKDNDRRPAFGRGPWGGPPSFGRGGPPQRGGPPAFARRDQSDDKDGKCPHCGRGGDSDKGRSHAHDGRGHHRGHGHQARGHHGHRGHGHHGHHRGHGEARGGHRHHGHHHGKGRDKDDDDDDRRGPPRRRPSA